MEIEVFKNAGFEIRGGLIDGEPYFIANDISSLLGYANTHAMIERLDEDEKFYLKDLLKSRTAKDIDLPKISGVRYDAILLTESGLYSAILWSQKPEAKQFKKWVTSEVLPSIRKHGAYLTPQKVEDILTDPDTLIQLATQLKTERALKEKALQEKAYIGSKREATAMATASKAIREVSKLQTILDISKEYSTTRKQEKRFSCKFAWSPLKKYCKENGLPIKKVNDDLFENVNSYPAEAWLEVHSVNIKD